MKPDHASQFPSSGLAIDDFDKLFKDDLSRFIQDAPHLYKTSRNSLHCIGAEELEKKWDSIHSELFRLWSEYCRNPKINIPERNKDILNKLLHLIRSRSPQNVDLDLVGKDLQNLKLTTLLSTDLTKSLVPVTVKSESNMFFQSASVCMFGNAFAGPWLKYATAHEIFFNGYSSHLSNLTGTSDYDLLRNIVSRDCSPNDAVIHEFSKATHRNVNIFYFDQKGYLNDFLNIDAVPNESCFNPKIFLGCFDGTYFPLIKLSPESVLPNISFTIAEKYSKDVTTQGGEVRIMIKIQEVNSAYSMPILSFRSETVLYAYDSKHPETHLYPFLKPESEMFVRCEECVTLKTLLCEHSKPALRALASFKERMQSIEPCKDSQNVIGINKSILPPRLSNIFEAFIVAGAGNCFYDAVSVCLIKDPCLGKCLRQAAGLEYLSNGNIRSLLNGNKVPDNEVYSRVVDGAWANGTSMFLVSSVISKRVEVIQLTSSGTWTSYFYDANTRGSEICIHLYLCSNHFYPLIPRDPTIELPAASCTPADYRQNDSTKVFNRIKNEDTNIEIVDLTNVADNEPMQSTFRRKSEFVPQAAPTQNVITHLTPVCTNMNIRMILLNNIVEQLENANDNKQYIQVCRKYNMISAEDTLGRRLSLRINGQRSQKEIKLINVSVYPILDGTSQEKILTKTYDKQASTPIQNEANSCSNEPPRVFAGKIVAKDGKYRPYIDHKFEVCLNAISENIAFLKCNEKDSTQSVKAYLKECVSSRVHWVEKAAPGVILTKNQLLARDKHSKLVFKLLKKPQYQEKFQKMLESHDVHYADELFNANSKSRLLPEQSSCSDECKNISDEVPSLSQNSPHKSDNESLNATDVSNTNENEEYIGKQAIADILGIEPRELDCDPPTEFEIEIQPEKLELMYDFEKSNFIKRKWAKEFSKALTTVQGACCFKAQRPVIYHKRESKDFATLEGRCGCGLYFVAQVKAAPVKGHTLPIYVSSKGVFHLMQSKFTGRPISGNERKEIAKKLQFVKAEAMFLENTNHVSSMRLLHGNLKQASRATLRKIKSDKNLENRLDPDQCKDILLQQKEYEDSTNPKSVIKGYIQYVNLIQGNFKIILFDQGSLSLHVDQVSKNGALCYFDSTGGVIPKQEGKEILLYRLLGKRKEGCAYNIAEMLAERGTIVEVADFLRRVKQGILKVRPSLRKQLADIIIVDWSWPLLHSVANAWNTETIQDYLNRSFAVLNEASTPWGKKSCIFICTSHLVNAMFRNLSKRLNSTKETKHIIQYALAGLARLQECYSLEELRSMTRDICRLFGQEKLNCGVFGQLCSRLSEHKNAIDLVDEKSSICLDSENDAAIELANSEASKLLREQSPFYHVFKREREMQMKVKEEDCNMSNPLFCPTILDVIEKEKIAMFPFWAAAVPRIVTRNTNFLRETNSTVESSFNQLKNLQFPPGRVTFPEFVRRRYEMHAGKNKDTLVKLVRMQVDHQMKEKPPLLLSESWKKKGKKGPSHFSPKIETTVMAKVLTSTAQTTLVKQTNTGTLHNGNPKVLYPHYGFSNVGNTCYLSATLQILLSIPGLASLTDESSAAHHFLTFIGGRLRGVTKAGCNQDDVRNIYECVNEMLEKSKVKERYSIGIQNDATEFLLSLINLPDMDKVKKLFEITFVRTHRCSSCGQQNEGFDLASSIQIYLKDGFEMGINSFLNNPGFSQCNKCWQNTMSTSVALANHPSYLLITTDLLQGNLNSRGVYEIQKVHSNEHLFLTLNIDNVQYELHGVICHRGMYSDSGHFVTYLRTESRLLCCDDDEIITEVDKPRGDVYMYMYRKV